MGVTHKNGDVLRRAPCFAACTFLCTGGLFLQFRRFSLPPPPNLTPTLTAVQLSPCLCAEESHDAGAMSRVLGKRGAPGATSRGFDPLGTLSSAAEAVLAAASEFCVIEAYTA